MQGQLGEAASTPDKQSECDESPYFEPVIDSKRGVALIRFPIMQKATLENFQRRISLKSIAAALAPVCGGSVDKAISYFSEALCKLDKKKGSYYTPGGADKVVAPVLELDAPMTVGLIQAAKLTSTQAKTIARWLRAILRRRILAGYEKTREVKDEHMDEMRAGEYSYTSDKGKEMKLPFVSVDPSESVDNNVKRVCDISKKEDGTYEPLGKLTGKHGRCITANLEIDHGKGQQRAGLQHGARNGDGLTHYSTIGSYRGSDSSVLLANTLIPSTVKGVEKLNNTVYLSVTAPDGQYDTVALPKDVCGTVYGSLDRLPEGME
jgi:hypothetical protein